MAHIRPRTIVRSGPATVVGSGAAPKLATGTPQAQAATTFGSATRILDASGNPISQDATVVGFDDALQQDFAIRGDNYGVVWRHNFTNAAEANQFRWTGGYGNDPGDLGGRDGTIDHSPTGGLSGGRLICHHPAGAVSVSLWNRPLAPIRGADNGIGTDDPGAAGLLTPVAWDSSNRSEAEVTFDTTGFFGNVAYDQGGGGSPAATFLGNEFFVQMRVRIGTERNDTPIYGGKLAMFTLLEASAALQEQVFAQFIPAFLGGGARDPNTNFIGGYRGVGSQDWHVDANDGKQPGSEYDDPLVCEYGLDVGSNPPSEAQKAACWQHAEDGTYDTYLFHWKAGTDGQNNTLLRLWGARQGESTYTLLFHVPGILGGYRSASPFGRNAFVLTPYTNADLPAQAPGVVTPFTIDHAEVIMSTRFIPAPMFFQNTELGAAALDLTSGQNVDLTALATPVPVTGFLASEHAWSMKHFYDPVRQRIMYMGKRASSPRPYRTAVYRLVDNVLEAENNLPEGSGHIYSGNAMDPETGDMFLQNYLDATTRWWNAETKTWGLTSARPGWNTGFDDDGVGNGLCWHPNLYGVGEGGLVLRTWHNCWFWRKSTDTWEEVERVTKDSTLSHYAGMEYLPALDMVVAIGGNQPRFNVTRNSTPLGTPVITEGVTGTTPPFDINSGSAASGAVIMHPSGTKLLAIEGAGTRVYQCSDGSNWTDTGYTHPLPQGAQASRSLCVIPDIGVIQGVNETMNTLWKVPA